ncbi:MAG: type II toxin-antitoxin system RelE/ParE family toxin [gamma proteobacterium symbiont of Bathyaustriella thionipta]|nr:type II toxin-antitoxin system RelE/ParE family toxin [gamma proteobacterium symbiont of Bathyaustriella thionipta]
MRVEYHPAVEWELREIIQYYNGFSAGLGSEFLNEFERQVLNIASNPLQWVGIEDGVRRALLRRFPYTVYFRVVSMDLLRITVVKHQRRHPRLGLKRK